MFHFSIALYYTTWFQHIHFASPLITTNFCLLYNGRVFLRACVPACDVVSVRRVVRVSAYACAYLCMCACIDATPRSVTGIHCPLAINFTSSK